MPHTLAHIALADCLGRFAAAVNAPYGFERSLKVSNHGLLGGRALITFHRSNLLAVGGWPAVSALLIQCGLSREHHPPLAAAFELAELVHFGLQGAPQLAVNEPWLVPNVSEDLSVDQVMKIYFESASVDSNNSQWSLAKWRPARIRPHFLAYKWRIGQAPVVTLYGICPPPDDGLVDIVIADITGSISPVLMGHIDRLLKACNRRLSCPDRQLLAVIEPSTMRCSIDVNLYSAELTFAGVKPFVLAALESVSPANSDALAIWVDAISNAKIGHLAWGCGGQKEPFITCYYGVREIAPGVSFLD